MRTFAVDVVEPAEQRLPTRPLRERYPDALAAGGDLDVPVVAHGGTHALLGAVGMAFAQHRPLVLSPDAIWLTIAQGVAQHVRLHAEQLRPRLVRHDGRKRLTVTVNAMPTDAAAWAAVVAAFRAELAHEIGDGRARLLECDFSTSTDVDRVASQIVLFDAYAPYFSLWMRAVCGIPTITLTGTVDDWRRIRARVDVIAELDLGWWCGSLAAIAEQLVRAAAGDVDAAFWRRIYNPADAYGGEVITGWITRLYPYLEADGSQATRNPMLALPIDEPKNLTTAAERWYLGPGVRSDAVPDTRSRVTVHVVDEVARARCAVALVAGVVAVAQQPDGGLRPLVGWHLEPARCRIAEVVDRIAREHRIVPLVENAFRRYREGPAEVIAFRDRFDSATLFEGDRAWQLLGHADRDIVAIEGVDGCTVRRFADIPGGRSLCYAVPWRTGVVHWILCRVERKPRDSEIKYLHEVRALDRSSEIAVLGSSLATILDAVLESGGEVDHLVVGTFDHVIR
jgi:hypothetical protein